MNKYCTLFSALLHFLLIKRYENCHGGGKSFQCDNNQWDGSNWFLSSRRIGANMVTFRIRSEQPRFGEGEELLLFDFLTENSSYDLRQSPRTREGSPQSPLVVRTSMFVYFIGNFDAQSLEFETHLLFRHRWRVRNGDAIYPENPWHWPLKDDRLNFSNLASFEVINGEDYFTDHIWTPNIFIENGRESTLMRSTGDSTYVRIFKTGEVELHYRLKTVVLCDMRLQRFPHDTQNCTILFESCEWLHWSVAKFDARLSHSGSEPSSEIVLEWDTEAPIGNKLILLWADDITLPPLFQGVYS